MWPGYAKTVPNTGSSPGSAAQSTAPPSMPHPHPARTTPRPSTPNGARVSTRDLEKTAERWLSARALPEPRRARSALVHGRRLRLSVCVLLHPPEPGVHLPRRHLALSPASARRAASQAGPHCLRYLAFVLGGRKARDRECARTRAASRPRPWCSTSTQSPTYAARAPTRTSSPTATRPSRTSAKRMTRASSSPAAARRIFCPRDSHGGGRNISFGLAGGVHDNGGEPYLPMRSPQ
jgi:hypothetical protein